MVHPERWLTPRRHANARYKVSITAARRRWGGCDSPPRWGYDGVPFATDGSRGSLCGDNTSLIEFRVGELAPPISGSRLRQPRPEEAPRRRRAMADD